MCFLNPIRSAPKLKVLAFISAPIDFKYNSSLHNSFINCNYIRWVSSDLLMCRMALESLCVCRCASARACVGTAGEFAVMAFSVSWLFSRVPSTWELFSPTQLASTVCAYCKLNDYWLSSIKTLPHGSIYLFPNMHVCRLVTRLLFSKIFFL